jgi:hypothetical protein
VANKVFQKRIADGVEKLLTEKSRARGTFRKHIETFNRKWKQYQKAKQREEKTGKPQPFCPDPSQWQGEKVVCYYTYLAVVYDSVKNVAPYYLCNDILDEQLFGYLQRQMSSANFDNDKLTTALKWVEADLEGQGGKAGGEHKGGRPRKYTPHQIQQFQKMFDGLICEGLPVRDAWNKVADHYSSTSGKAVEMACRRGLKKENK